jgi:two-component sensor histidine kinase
VRFHPDISSIESFYDRGKFLLAWRISMFFLIIFVALTLFYGMINPVAMIPSGLAVSVAAVCLLYLWLRKNYKPLFWAYATAGTLLANFAMNLVLDFTHFVDFIWILDAIILAFVGLGWVGGISFAIVNAIGLAYFFFVSVNRHIEILEPKTQFELIADYTEVLFALFVAAYLLYQFIVFQSHAEKSLTHANKDLANQNQLIQQKNMENETLMKEIHHRVKNNLQIIISLLRMQSAELKSEESKVHFTEAINRIMTMSLIHQKLYSEKELSKVKLKSYLEQLVSEILKAFQGDSKVNIQIETSVEDVHPDMIVPMGLLVNELVSNSLKHAFKPQETGVIELHVYQKGHIYKLNYSDSGTWKNTPDSESSFGLELIDILTDQMNGTKELTTENGTHYHFQLSDNIQH